MRKRTIVISLGTALALMCSSVGVLALGDPITGNPVGPVNTNPTINKPTTPPVYIPQPVKSIPPTSLLPGGGGSGGDGNGSNGLGGGPSVAVKKLVGKPLDICKVHQNSINIILNRVVKRGTNQLNFFNEVATKVETYVTTNNLTVPNYSTLVTTINSDQTKVQQDISALKANDTFNCLGSNPTNTASGLKAELKQEVSDLQTFRNDIKNLIVAVKAVVAQSSSKPSGSN